MRDFELKLYEEFPDFFDRSRLCPFGERGFEINAGWYQLVRELVHEVEAQAKEEGKLNAIYCGQCKEKFSTLSVYVHNQSKKIKAITDEFRSRSAYICPETGEHRVPTDTTHIYCVDGVSN